MDSLTVSLAASSAPALSALRNRAAGREAEEVGVGKGLCAAGWPGGIAHGPMGAVAGCKQGSQGAGQRGRGWIAHLRHRPCRSPLVMQVPAPVDQGWARSKLLPGRCKGAGAAELAALPRSLQCSKKESH